MKQSLGKFPKLLSQLLHSRVILTVLCSLHFSNSILSSLTNAQKFWCADNKRCFACTGLLIRGGDSQLVLTSASLVRTGDVEGEIDEKLTVS